MDLIEKLQFVFCAYDFDNRGSISYDETALLIRSVASGCSKSFPTAPVFNLAPGVVENYAHLVFTSLQKSQDDRVSTGEFQNYCVSHPVIKSWLRFVSNIASPNSATPDFFEEKDDIVKATFVRYVVGFFLS